MGMDDLEKIDRMILENLWKNAYWFARMQIS